MAKINKYRMKLSKEERAELTALTTAGRLSARAMKRALIMLKADEGPDGPAWADTQIKEAFEVSLGTVTNVRKRYLQRGWESVIRGTYAGHNPRVLDGEAEAHLIALACSEPPDQRESWTMQLLADRLVALRHLPHLSDETVRLTLKKTNSSRG
jgi:transposase